MPRRRGRGGPDAAWRSSTSRTRYFSGAPPEWRSGPLTQHGTISVLTLPSDNDTWSVTVCGSSRDVPLKELRRPDCFDRVLRGFPLQAHWVDAPADSGVVGDAWACTNPSAGKGISVGLMHAQLLRDVLRLHLDDPAAFAAAFHELGDDRVAPWVRDQLRADRARVAEMNALRRGETPPAPDPDVAAFAAAAVEDPEVFRAFLEGPPVPRPAHRDPRPAAHRRRRRPTAWRGTRAPARAGPVGAAGPHRGVSRTRGPSTWSRPRSGR